MVAQHEVNNEKMLMQIVKNRGIGFACEAMKVFTELLKHPDPEVQLAAMFAGRGLVDIVEKCKVEAEEGR